jgi:polyhydroxybutyrate depolymerase
VRKNSLKNLFASATRIMLLLTSSCASVGSATAASGPLAPGDHDNETRVGGMRRTYRVHVPSSAGTDRPVPLVFLFHYGFGTGEGMQKNTQMDAIADREGFITVYADGVARGWNAGTCCGRASEENIDDVGFVVAMIKEIGARHPIEPKRIYATGLSNGGMFAYRLACEKSDTFAAVGVVSAVVRTSSCNPTRPVPIIHIHGTADPRVPWKGGVGKNKATGYNPPVMETIEGWVKRNGCSPTPKVTLKKGAVTCDTYPSSNGADVTLCRIEGGGHNWPGSKPSLEKLLGPVNQDISASEEIWKFFKAHPMP